MKKIKPSDIEKQWGEDLERRGVFDKAPEGKEQPKSEEECKHELTICICKHERCSFCKECHNQSCGNFVGATDGCYKSILPKSVEQEVPEQECKECGHLLKYHQAVRFGDACTYGDCPCVKFIKQEERTLEEIKNMSHSEYQELHTVEQEVPEIVKKLSEEAHIKWLSKAETAKINGNEMTVLPYGYLSQAVKEALLQAVTQAELRGEQRAREEMVKTVEGKKRKISRDGLETYGGYYWKGYNYCITDIINLLKTPKWGGGRDERHQKKI